MESQDKGHILIVDDEKNMCSYLSIILKKNGFRVSTALTGEKAFELAQEQRFDLIIQDVRLKKMSGIELLKKFKEQFPNIPVVIMTAYSTWGKAAEAMRIGAYDFIKKPFENKVIRNIADRLCEYHRANKIPSEKNMAEEEGIFHAAQIIGNSSVMDDIFAKIDKAKETAATALITGESGVGKELVARALHYGSMRREEPFICINCSALVGTLLESEIFGHVKGAFTGADCQKKGLIEVADQGTFFMDEIGDLDTKLQGKILKVLENREFYPVGSTEKKYIDVRFTAATNQNLEELIKTGKFREDLFYRLNVIQINIPPLRNRKEDIPLLAGHFLKKYSGRYAKNIEQISDKALEKLAEYSWPGNVRELENCMHRAIISADSNAIEKKDLSSIPEEPVEGAKISSQVNIPPGFNLEDRISSIEKQYIQKALEITDGNITRAAESLGISFRSLRYKIKKYSIDTKK